MIPDWVSDGLPWQHDVSVDLRIAKTFLTFGAWFPADV